MFIHRNNNNRRTGKSRAGGLIGLIIFVIVVFNIINNSASRRHSSPPGNTWSPPTQTAPYQNPIMRELEATGQEAAIKRDGVAIAVLFDVSGSMSGSVPAAGNPVAKINSARNCALGLLRKVADFSRQHPDKMVQTSIMEFSTRQRQDSCRIVIPFGALDMAKATEAIARMRAEGGTPIGDAMLFARRQLVQTGLRQQHLLLITDGQNTTGYSPADVMNGFTRLPAGQAPSVYFIAFDTAAEQFSGISAQGGLLLSAANDSELNGVIDYVLTGKILAEQPGQQEN